MGCPLVTWLRAGSPLQAVRPGCGASVQAPILGVLLPEGGPEPSAGMTVTAPLPESPEDQRSGPQQTLNELHHDTDTGSGEGWRMTPRR